MALALPNAGPADMEQGTEPVWALGDNKLMPACACDCGGETAAGTFLPGHDQRLRADIERRAGGLLNLSRLVTCAEDYVNGRVPLSDLNAILQEVLRSPRR